MQEFRRHEIQLGPEAELGCVVGSGLANDVRLGQGRRCWVDQGLREIRPSVLVVLNVRVLSRGSGCSGYGMVCVRLVGLIVVAMAVTMALALTMGKRVLVVVVVVVVTGRA